MLIMTLLRHVGFFHFKNALFDLGNAQLLVSEFFGYFKYYNLSTNNVRRGPIKVLGQWLCPIVGRVVASDTRGPGFESAKII